MWIRMLVVGGILIAAGPARAAPVYTVTGLGNLGDDADTQAWALNDSGQVVGWSRTSSRLTHAFLWDAATGMQDLGVLLPDGSQSKAVGINDAGQVVGHWWGADEIAHAFVYDPATGMRDLAGLIPVGWSLAYAINDSGQVAGEAQTSVLVHGHAVLWDPATGIKDLGTLGGHESQARAINNSGQVVGLARTSTGATHAVLWDPAMGTKDLGTPGTGATSVAEDINDRGQVVGYCETDAHANHAFLWDSAAGMKDLGAFGLYYSHAYGINDAGHIVGSAASGADDGPSLWFLHDGAAAWDLRDLVPADARWMVRAPNDISNRGQITGGACLMTPVPEPSAWMMLSSVLATFGLARPRGPRR